MSHTPFQRAAMVALPLILLAATPVLSATTFLSTTDITNFSQSLQGKDCQDPTVQASAQLQNANVPGMWSGQTVNPQTAAMRFTMDVPYSSTWSALGKSMYPTQWTSDGVTVGAPHFFQNMTNGRSICTFDRTYAITSTKGTLAAALKQFAKDSASITDTNALPVISLKVGAWKAALIPTIQPAGLSQALMNYQTLTIEANGVLITFSRQDHRLDGSIFRMAESVKR